jgi:type I restriction enzyme M protein
MSNVFTAKQLESHLWEAANILRGPVDAADFKTYVFPLLFFKRISDVHDEEYAAALAESGGDEEYAQFPQNYRFQVPENCHWNDVRVIATNVGQAMQKAMRGIEKANPETLYGIFGDAQWTNKDRLSDSLLRDLIEHFSRINIDNAAAQADILGQAYEYLIKKFADATNKKAGEFYTPRSVVRLMVNILDPREGDSIYDPACGTGGMLLEAIHHVRENHGDDRTLWGKLFAQEKNLTTSAIARMNLFLHGIEDFRIERGDTLSEPKFVQGDRLMRFDMVLANPPYSIKQWDRAAFASDPWGRNLYGVPPQGRADYAFWQHIIQSLAPKTGRTAILFPHGVLFRQEEAEMRRKIIEADLIECVLGLGPNLFYNSPMEACIVVCRTDKPKIRKGKILFINAVNEVTRERAQSFLTDDHIGRIVAVYRDFKDEPGFTCVATREEIRARDGNLSIPLYVAGSSAMQEVRDEAAAPYTANGASGGDRLTEALTAWLESSRKVGKSLSVVLEDKK